MCSLRFGGLNLPWRVVVAVAGRCFTLSPVANPALPIAADLRIVADCG